MDRRAEVGVGARADLDPRARAELDVGAGEDPGVRPHAVLVGVGPGLGASLARVLADSGYDLTLMARRATSTDPVAEQVAARGARARTELLDISDLDALTDAVRRADQWRAIAHLHHNASMHAGSLMAADPPTLRTSLAVNAAAAVVAVQAALPGLTRTGGRVTWTGGGVALRPHPDYGVLAMGKAALRAAAQALAPELADRGIDLRMMTITGIIQPGGPFDPDRIARAFWAFAQEPGDDVERVYDGQPGDVEPAPDGQPGEDPQPSDDVPDGQP